MNACGIITEYNPFHNGHLYHIQQARKLTHCDCLIAVMSGNFVQRGEPAIVDKWKRTEAALAHGVDLVIELPVIYANQSANRFAQAGVTLLQLADVSSMVFGSESNNLRELQKIASMPIQVDNLKENLKTGMGFPKAYGLMAKEYGPNDILGIAYLKALQATAIIPYTIQRTTEYHEEALNGSVVSAKAIRKAILEEKEIDTYTPMEIDITQIKTMNQYYPYLQTLLLTLEKDYLASLFLFGEGIENHLVKQAMLYDDYPTFLSHACTKRYTRARVQRTLVSLLCQFTKEKVRKLPPLDTLRVLGFNETGQSYLKELKAKEVRIASRYNQIPKPYRIMEYRAAVVYSMFDNNPSAFLEREIAGPIRYKKENEELATNS